MRFRLVEDINENIFYKYGWTNDEDERTRDWSEYITDKLYEDDNDYDVIATENYDNYSISKCRLLNEKGKVISGTIYYTLEDEDGAVYEEYPAYKSLKDAKHLLNIMKKLNND